MFRNYLVTSWRNLVRKRVFSIINVTGLAIGLAVGGLIYLFVAFEQGYDRFNTNIERLYRVPITYESTGETGMQITPLAVNNPAVGPALETDFPEVEAATRMVRTSLVMSTLTLSYEAPERMPSPSTKKKFTLPIHPFSKYSPTAQRKVRPPVH